MVRAHGVGCGRVTVVSFSYAKTWGAATKKTGLSTDDAHKYVFEAVLHWKADESVNPNSVGLSGSWIVREAVA